MVVQPRSSGLSTGYGGLVCALGAQIGMADLLQVVAPLVTTFPGQDLARRYRLLDNGAMGLRNIIVVLLLAGAAVACVSETGTESSDTPKIVDVFACSDYCPGPEEKYVKRVYDGVTDEGECRKLGGKLYTITGWGKRTICEVQ